MKRMNIVAGIAELEPVAAPLVHRVRRLHRLHRKGFTIEGPLVETLQRAVALDDRHLDCLVWRSWHPVGLAEPGVVPAERLGFGPLRLALGACVFDDDA